MADFFAKMRARLAKHSGQPDIGHHGCVLWTGAQDRDHYGVCRVTWPGTGQKKVVRVARLAYMCKIGRLELPRQMALGDGGRPVTVEVSHLCHQRLCIKPEHLTLEAKSVNLERKHCVSQRVCMGHAGQPNCLL